MWAGTIKTWTRGRSTTSSAGWLVSKVNGFAGPLSTCRARTSRASEPHRHLVDSALLRSLPSWAIVSESDLLADGPPELVKRTVQKTRARYARHMAALFDAIRRPTLLFWFSNRSPEYEEDYASVGGILAAFPQLVRRATLDEIRTHTHAYVECTSTTGIPQTLWKAERGIDGTTLEGSWLVNHYYPSPDMHAEAAALLTPVCARLMSPGSRVTEDAPTRQEPALFVITLCRAHRIEHAQRPAEFASRVPRGRRVVQSAIHREPVDSNRARRVPI
jgi:Domain of unknown function (DUF6473)